MQDNIWQKKDSKSPIPFFFWVVCKTQKSLPLGFARLHQLQSYQVEGSHIH